MTGRRADPPSGLRPGGAIARILLLLIGAVALAPPAAVAPPAAADDLAALQALVARHAPQGLLPEVDGLRRACRGDLRCAAERIVAAWPDGARLQAVPDPDPQLVRSGALPRSVTAVRRRPGALRVRINRFGRSAAKQVLASLVGLRPGETLELDLRRHRGGSVSRMLEVASLFVGPKAQAMRIVGRHAVVLAVPPPARRAEAAALDVLIGPDTRSSAEVLAALLHRYAGARLVGERTFGKNWAERPVRLGSGWYLMIRAGEILVDGEVLEGGLVPDVPSGS